MASSSTNLYVGNLPKTITDHQLKALFECYGPIASLKVMIDPTTNVSKGFGFVQFDSPTAALCALSSMNNFMVEGQPLNVKLADRDAASGMGGSSSKANVGIIPNDNVFVGGIPPEWTEVHLNQLVSQYGGGGKIVRSTVLKDKVTGRPKSAGLVRFVDVSTASFVVQQLNGAFLQGATKPLEARFAEVKDAKVAPVTTTTHYQPYPQVMARGNSPGAAAAAAAANPAVAAGYGAYPVSFPPVPPTLPVTSAIFGTSASPAAAGNAGTAGTPTQASIQVPKPAFQPEENTNLHIWGLESNVGDLTLYEAFSPYGAIYRVKVILDPTTKQSKGYGFVQFYRASDAEAAISNLHGAVVCGKTWTITHHKKKS